MKQTEFEKNYPVAVTMRFRSKEEKRKFLGQLSDGWGENVCDVTWPGRCNFTEAASFGVDLFDEG